PVNSGDQVRMHSDVQPNAFKVTQNQNFLTVVAPIALLRVTADDGVTRSEAYCASIPFLQMVQPTNDVVSVSNAADDVVHVVAAIPLVDPAKLVIVADGVDLLALLGIGNPSSCSRISPCGGSTTVNGHPVTIANLVVDTAPVNLYASNTVSFDIQGL